MEDRVKDIPTTGRGQKKAWLELCLKLISEQNPSKVRVPVSACREKNRLVSAVDAHGVAVLVLHPTVWNIRITFEDKVCLLICFDLETTGLGIYQVQITQFGAVCALSRPGEQLELVGTYSSYVECKMRFPHDVTVLTGIKHWFHEDSPLRGAPTLAEVNAQVQSKMVEWRKTVQTKYGKTIYSQLVGWNSDSYDIPLWALQTDEHEGEGAWSKRFLSEDTGLVAHTDLYRLTPYAGFVPKTVKDIQVYMTKERDRSKKKKKTDQEDVVLIEYGSPQAALWAYVQHHYPDTGFGMSNDIVGTVLATHNDDVARTLRELIDKAEANMIVHKQQVKANRKRKRKGGEPNVQPNNMPSKRRKARRWVPETKLGNFHKWLLGREIIGYHGALEDARATFDVLKHKEVRVPCEEYFSETKKQLHRYVAKSLAMKYKQIQMRAREKAKEQHGISRHPYGLNPSPCLGHSYPCSIAVEKRKGSFYCGKTYECCNWGFKSRLQHGEDRRCGHKVFL